MLILLGVTTNISLNFNEVKDTVDDTNSKVSQSQNGVNNLIEEWNNIESGTSGETGGGAGEETGGGTTDPELDRSYLAVGDYVAYTPETTNSSYSLLAIYSEYDSDQTIERDTTLTWRIMSINYDGTVDLISTVPTSTKVYFKRALGYNNGVYVLNDLCKSLYSNTTLGVTARSLDLEDIEAEMNSTGLAARDAYNNGTYTYGAAPSAYTSNTKTPDIYTKVAKTTVGESLDYYTTPTIETFTEPSILEAKQTYYYFSSTPSSYFDVTKFHELIFDTGMSFWLATRYTDCAESSAYFGLRYVKNADLRGNELMRSGLNAGSSKGSAVRPVVTLGSDIKISTNGGSSADDARTISK